LPIDRATYQKIRRLYTIDKMSIRAIARILGVGRNTVKKYCEGYAVYDDPNDYPENTANPLRDCIEKEIQTFLEENKEELHKQKITAKHIWYWLRYEKGYQVGESTVRKYAHEMKQENPELFVPLVFEPGEAMQVDWGDYYVYIQGVKIRVHGFCAVLPYSFDIHVSAYPRAIKEAFFMGHVKAFEFFGGVPLRCIYDNLKIAVLEGSGKNAIKQESFKRLEAHYAFEAVFCNVASGNEKGGVENLVNIIRKIAFTPIPRVKDFTELNEYLTSKCLEYCENHKIRGRSLSIREAFNIEKENLLPLPGKPLDIAKSVTVKVYKDLTVHFDGNKYSVPPEFAGKSVTLKAYPFELAVYYKGNHIYTHKRTYKKDNPQYDPMHYLKLLERKPRAIMNAAPLKEGIMPEELKRFVRLYRGKDKNEQLVEVLKLARAIDADKLLEAVGKANESGNPTYQLICFYLNIHSKLVTNLDSLVQVDKTDFKGYDKLIPEGGETSE